MAGPRRHTFATISSSNTLSKTTGNHLGNNHSGINSGDIDSVSNHVPSHDVPVHPIAQTNPAQRTCELSDPRLAIN
jgi:hypothetical protein